MNNDRGRRFYLLVVLFVCLCGHPSFAQRELGARGTDSGGPLLPEQAAYDVKFYDLAVRVNVAARSIAGVLTVRALIVQPTEWFVLDLDTPLAVSAVEALDEKSSAQVLRFERRGGRVWVAFPSTKQPGETVRVRVTYAGVPREAPRPPWVGGFVWSQTAGGEPWVGVACQSDGADLWWPCKDHPSDEPDAMALHITVPENLVCAANGRLQGVVKNGDGTHTFNWYVSTPINNYDVTMNIAPYRTVEAQYQSVTGEILPVTFWVLPENYERGRELLPHFLTYLKFLEERFGPYPFRVDKIGVAETSYLGMENQTINAYGNKYRTNAYGFVGLMFHELSHEWWGNLVTAVDWRDFWLHEGFASYTDALYVGEMKGAAAYEEYIANLRGKIRNRQPVAPREARTAAQVYLAAPDYTSSDGDIYNKGALVLHTLRYLIGDEAFFKALRRMAYPDPRLEAVKDGGQCRFATTEDFRLIAENASGMKLGWFFDLYLRQPKLPRLVGERSAGALSLRWETPENLPFPMPVEVKIGGQTRRVEMKDNRGNVPFAAGQEFVIDPDARILKED